MTQPVAHSSLLDQALAVYLEPHAEGRRVLLLGEAEGALAERLSRVAERLEIIDPEHRVPADVGVPELPFRDAVFDLVLVLDVTLLPEPRPEAVRELRRVTRDDGILLLGLSPNGEDANRRRRGAPEEALQRLLAAEFHFTRVIEQGPVSGYSFSLNDGQPDDFSIDSSLMGTTRRQALRYLALGSDVRVALESRLWIQVPEREGEGAAAAPSQALIAELRRAEEAVREALRRETELLRELEAERKAHALTERGVERVKHLERKLIEIEGDYDDAVGRVRFLENELSDRDAVRERERAQREKAERELGSHKQQLAALEAGRKAAEQAYGSAQEELAALQEERGALEERLQGAAGQILALGRDIKHQETVAKDLLEELRTREQSGQRAVEHDARVSELEAERARAVERALQAEVSRESATMRADELRAQIHALTAAEAAAREAAAIAAKAAPAAEAELAAAASDDSEAVRVHQVEASRSRGEISGLRWRLKEAEAALTVQRDLAERAQQGSEDSDAGSESEAAASELWAERLDQAQDRIEELEDALARSERRAQEAGRTVELEAELDRMDHRVRELTRDLEEADRLAEAHSEDAERLDALDVELEAARRRMDALEDELRSTQDELRATRTNAEALAAETTTRVELAQRVAAEARTERDDARVALAEARSILAQLAGGEAQPGLAAVAVPAEASASVEAELRAELEERNARLFEVERELAERAQRILQLEENLRAQVRGSVPPPPFGSSDA